MRVLLFGYLHAAFGAFRPSYAYYDPNSFSFMQQQGYMGLTYPHPDRLLKLLFGCSRGLFFASPVLAAAPVGLWRLRRQGLRAAACGDRGLLLFVQCVVLLVESRADVWSALRGGVHSIVVCGLGGRVGPGSTPWRRVLLGLAVVQRVRGGDGGVDDFAAGHAG